MSVKINQLEIENVKRIRACKIEPSPNGLTIIGGKNGQGKTSTLDSIAWALGGDRYRPSEATREGSVIPPAINIKLSNGLIVERKGKNSDLKVTDPDGKKSGQQLLNEFVEQLAIDLPRFIQSTSREKAETLLKIIGVGDQLKGLEVKEQELYNQRLAIGRIADQKKKFAQEMAYYSDAPKDLISISELIKQQQGILAQNGENQRKRENLVSLKNEYNKLYGQVEDLKARLEQLTEERDKVYADVLVAEKSAFDLHDESTEELERNIANIELINEKVRSNLNKEKAEGDAALHSKEYDTITSLINDVRQRKIDLLNAAKLPLPGLSVQDGELVYNGRKWDCMSGSEQLKVSTAIVRSINPKCGFVLLDKLEQMDTDTLKEFGEWLESEGLQAIATRVSTGDECSIVIEDGYVVGADAAPDTGIMASEETVAPPAQVWKVGEF